MLKMMGLSQTMDHLDILILKTSSIDYMHAQMYRLIFIIIIESTKICQSFLNLTKKVEHSAVYINKKKQKKLQNKNLIKKYRPTTVTRIVVLLHMSVLIAMSIYWFLIMVLV